MGAKRRILIVTAGETAETVREAARRVNGEVIEATDGTDAVKRIDTESVDVVVVPASLTDVSLDALLARLPTSLPTIVVGDGDEVGRDVDCVESDVSVGVLASHIDRTLQDHQIGVELDRHDRLKTVLVRVATAIGQVRKPDQIERLLVGELDGIDAYRSIWVGRYDPEDATVEFVRPFRRRVASEDFGRFIGEPDTDVLSRALSEGIVTTSAGTGHPRGAEGDPSATAPSVSVIPLQNGDRVHGVIVLETDPDATPDGSERTVLGSLGRIVSLAVSSEPESDDRIEGMMSVLGHELRNPLQLAGLSMEAAREQDDEDAFRTLADALDRMENIVDSTIAMARGEVSETEPIEVHELAVDVWSDLTASSAELTVAQPVTVQGDPSLVERLVSNLLRNAVDHAGPDVSVRVGGLSDGIGFYVEDDGPGIPTGNRSDIFEWGWTTRNDGVGIGLSFVREIAKSHDWEIRVTEARDGGSRFEVITDPESMTDRDDHRSSMVESGSEPARSEGPSSE